MSGPTDISGTTRLYGIVGDPIDQVRSPAAFNAHFAKLGLDAVFLPFHVHAEGLAAAMAGFRSLRNLDGLVITVPHKFAFAELADELGDGARLVGAINALRRTDDDRWIGELFDGIGFVESLRASRYEPAGKSFLIIGAGGAGSAIGSALLPAGASRITIADAIPERAESLRRKLATAAPEVAVEAVGPNPDPDGYDVVANATPLGMRKEDPLPVDPDRLSDATLVADAIMKPAVTRLLREAEKRGCRTQPGQHMLDNQFLQIVKFLDLPGGGP